MVRRINRIHAAGPVRGSKELLMSQPAGATWMIWVFLASAIQMSPECAPIEQANELVT